MYLSPSLSLPPSPFFSLCLSPSYPCFRGINGVGAKENADPVERSVLIYLHQSCATHYYYYIPLLFTPLIEIMIDYTIIFNSSLSFVYPHGSTLTVQKPSTAILSSGSTSYPLNRPVCAFCSANVSAHPLVAIATVAFLVYYY